MRQKLLIICGPTAVGKTNLGVELAKKYNGEIVSADSRQVYKGMDIGTGKDIPENSKFKIQNLKFSFENKAIEIGFRKKEGIPIWLVDAVVTKYQFNLADFKRAATLVILDILSRGKLPIVVGGTGLYIKSLLSKIDTIFIPQDNKLRRHLEKDSVEQLQQKLKDADIKRFEQMNNSDSHNPRRLIRAIEVAHYTKTPQKSSDENSSYDYLLLGLRTVSADLKNKIAARVENRITAGLEREVKSLRDQGIDWDSAAMSATGYQVWQSYFAGNVSHSEVIVQMKQAEIQYAKRQMTYFKKMENINWFDILDRKSQSAILAMVDKWYTKK